MSLIVETGAANPDSEAYATVLFADTYHSNMGNSLWATLVTVEKEQALRRAASFMCQMYRLQWKGVRVSADQALDWPRYDVTISDLGVWNTVSSDIIPDLVQRANAELALLAAAGNLNPVKKQGVLSKSVGPIKIVYDTASPTSSQYVAIRDMLRPFLNTASSATMKLQRT